MSSPLARAKRAARRKEAAELEYRAAVLEAFEAGHSYAELARELGLTRQTVRVLVERERARQA